MSDEVKKAGKVGTAARYGSLAVAIGYAQRLLDEEPGVHRVLLVPESLPESGEYANTPSTVAIRVSDLVPGHWYVLTRETAK